jgi:hypothetical protein
MSLSLYEQLERDLIEARRARLAWEREQRELAQMRSELVGFQLDLAIIKLKRALARKYRADQPRLPAGSGRESGRWAGGESPAPVAPHDATPHGEARVVLAGGFTSEDMNLTVDQFASRHCEGRIQRQIPGQYRGSTISELLAAADAGDAAAKRCKKLLGQDRFRK